MVWSVNLEGMVQSWSSWYNQLLKIIREGRPKNNNAELMGKTWPTFGEWRVKIKAWRLGVCNTKSHFQLSFSKQGERRNETQQLLHRLDLIHGNIFLTACDSIMIRHKKGQVKWRQREIKMSLYWLYEQTNYIYMNNCILWRGCTPSKSTSFLRMPIYLPKTKKNKNLIILVPFHFFMKVCLRLAHPLIESPLLLTLKSHSHCILFLFLSFYLTASGCCQAPCSHRWCQTPRRGLDWGHRYL